MLRLLYPQVLWLLGLLPLLFYWELRHKRYPTLIGSDLFSQQKLLAKHNSWKPIASITLRLLILALLILGLTRPQMSYNQHDVESYGLDIILVLDTSGTMRAEDLQPNRLVSAKSAIADFIRKRKADRIGLVVFASRSYTVCPLTLDHDILISILDNIQFDMVEDGTAIGMAITNGVNRLRKSTAKSKVIILLTDGENNAGDVDPETAAKLAQSLEIKIYTVGIGKLGGAPIPINHPKLGRIYARKPDGQLQLTRLNEKSLSEIASLTKGKYFRAANKKGLNAVYQQIDDLEKTELKSKQSMYTELFQYFLLSALILLIMEFILKWTWWRRLP